MVSPSTVERILSTNKWPLDSKAEIKRIFDKDQNYFCEGVMLCIECLGNLGHTISKKYQNATSLRLALEYYQILLAPKRYIGKTHLAIAFDILEYKVKFEDQNYFNVNANCKIMKNLAVKILNNNGERVRF